MARLALLLALSHATFISALPASPLNVDTRERLDKRAITITASSVTISYSSDLVDPVQTAIPTGPPLIIGTINTALLSDVNSLGPVISNSVADPDGSLAPISTVLSPSTRTAGAPAASNVFVPMPADPPPPQIPVRDDHPERPLGVYNDGRPIHTNKFYANFFLGSQTSPVWTHPYSLNWAKGRGETWGLAVQHVEWSEFATDGGTPPRYFIGPVGVQNIVFSAAELGPSTMLTTESLTAFSVYANLHTSRGTDPLISFPCVQGMGFVTAAYRDATPILNSGTYFTSLEYIGLINGVTYKYQIELADGSNWLLYATAATSIGAIPFSLEDSTTIVGPERFIGIIQIAKNPAGEAGESTFDASAGSYAINATISGSVEDAAGSYTLAWNKGGIQNQTLLMFALPHHIESFDPTTSETLTDIELATTTKGYARAVLADSINMIEHNLPNTVGFGPWIPRSDGGNGGLENNFLNAATRIAINNAAASELNQDMIKQTRLDSMYYSGKGLAKFAQILYTLQDMSKNSPLAAAGLIKLKDAFNVFINNTQPFPLVYDAVWKGVVSSGTYQYGNPGLDFGNSYYNDHHFHYGYFVWAASVIGYLDPTWLTEGTNKAWIDMLVRDYANPSDLDPYFPFTRSFDWFHGHSWAKGLFESGDGKDQESTSEDTFATYALKMWGRVTANAALEARANLQLAVQARSLKNYFLLQDDNRVQPPGLLPNKVTGILFENKLDHTTYFGSRPEMVQGIHMIPLNPSSTYTRPKSFVQEEWDAYFSNGRADTAQGGWKGILYANLALIDPVAAFEFFSDPGFDSSMLDGGASRTWYLAWCAALGGVDMRIVPDENTTVSGDVGGWGIEENAVLEDEEEELGSREWETLDGDDEFLDVSGRWDQSGDDEEEIQDPYFDETELEDVEGRSPDEEWSGGDWDGEEYVAETDEDWSL